MFFTPAEIKKCAAQLRAGKIGLFPCDTVWGLIGLCTPAVIARINALKQRQIPKPFLILLPNAQYLSSYVQPLAAWQQAVVAQLWPGPVSLIFNKAGHVADELTGGLPTLGLRVPDFMPLNCLLEELAQPLISTSANLATMNIPEQFTQVNAQILAGVDFVYQQIEPRAGQPSTLIDLTQKPPQLLRGQWPLNFSPVAL